MSPFFLPSHINIRFCYTIWGMKGDFAGFKFSISILDACEMLQYISLHFCVKYVGKCSFCLWWRKKDFSLHHLACWRASKLCSSSLSKNWVTNRWHAKLGWKQVFLSFLALPHLFSSLQLMKAAAFSTTAKEALEERPPPFGFSFPSKPRKPHVCG